DPGPHHPCAGPHRRGAQGVAAGDGAHPADPAAEVLPAALPARRAHRGPAGLHGHHRKRQTKHTHHTHYHTHTPTTHHTPPPPPHTHTHTHTHTETLSLKHTHTMKG